MNVNVDLNQPSRPPDCGARFSQSGESARPGFGLVRRRFHLQNRPAALHRRRPGIVRAVAATGARIFLDLKLHDIPNTVAKAVAAAGDLGVQMLTVHLSGGRAMLEAAVAASPPNLSLLGVTVLTSATPGNSDGNRSELWRRGTGVCASPSSGRKSGIDGLIAQPARAANSSRTTRQRNQADHAWRSPELGGGGRSKAIHHPERSVAKWRRLPGHRTPDHGRIRILAQAVERILRRDLRVTLGDSYHARRAARLRRPRAAIRSAEHGGGRSAPGNRHFARSCAFIAGGVPRFPSAILDPMRMWRISASQREIVRRWTGGGVVPHGDDLTYSVIIPAQSPVFRPLLARHLFRYSRGNSRGFAGERHRCHARELSLAKSLGGLFRQCGPRGRDERRPKNCRRGASAVPRGIAAPGQHSTLEIAPPLPR